ncbi:hypothetical protein QTO30_06990 [Yoonia sp. GPGPB17]|uniref:hypothetical protein n=1 Tax=Yoonia sp. GPGPB17 TaxID=3026147 RepID=UPI0030BCB0C5
MAMFRGQIEDWFNIPKPRFGLMLTRIEGMPKVGMRVQIEGCFGTILELGRNSTDGQPVSYRDCVSGMPCAAYGSILVELSEYQPERGQWVEEVAAT